MRVVTRDSTLTEIATRTAHHPETVRRYMRGQDPSIRFVQRLCQAYGIDANWMLLGTESAPKVEMPTHRPLVVPWAVR